MSAKVGREEPVLGLPIRSRRGLWGEIWGSQQARPETLPQPLVWPGWGPCVSVCAIDTYSLKEDLDLQVPPGLPAVWHSEWACQTTGPCGGWTPQACSSPMWFAVVLLLALGSFSLRWALWCGRIPGQDCESREQVTQFSHPCPISPDDVSILFTR